MGGFGISLLNGAIYRVTRYTVFYSALAINALVYHYMSFLFAMSFLYWKEVLVSTLVGFGFALDFLISLENQIHFEL